MLKRSTKILKSEVDIQWDDALNFQCAPIIRLECVPIIWQECVSGLKNFDRVTAIVKVVEVGSETAVATGLKNQVLNCCS